MIKHHKVTRNKNNTTTILLLCYVRVDWCSMTELYKYSQVSTMSLYEHYSMCIPIFAPSLGFLTRLHLQHKFVCDKNVIGLGQRQRESELPVHPDYNGYARVPQNENESPLCEQNQIYNARSKQWLRWAQCARLALLCRLGHVATNRALDSYDQVAEILHAMWTYPRFRQCTMVCAQQIASVSSTSYAIGASVFGISQIIAHSNLNKLQYNSVCYFSVRAAWIIFNI